MSTFSRLVVISMAVLFFSGCASVPMENDAHAQRVKVFSAPDEGKAGVYLYRSSFLGKHLKKDLWIDGDCIGESANKVFFYTQVQGGQEHTIATESEFSPNLLSVFMEAGKNYFIRQYLVLGAFVNGADLELVDEERGRAEIEKLPLAVSGTCSREFPRRR